MNHCTVVPIEVELPWSGWTIRAVAGRIGRARLRGASNDAVHNRQ